MPFVSNDEDLELFLEDFGRILRKYHYDISPFTLRKISDVTIVIGGFSSLKGDGVLSPQYYFRLTDGDSQKIIDKMDGK